MLVFQPLRSEAGGEDRGLRCDGAVLLLVLVGSVRCAEDDLTDPLLGLDLDAGEVALQGLALLDPLIVKRILEHDGLSVFPTSLGVNPQETIYGLARLAASRLAAAWRSR